jgi:peptidoglycan/xylan/chitin deacetylase (PgdA/CDA1 family)
VPAGDDAALADRVSRLLADPQLCDRYGEAARKIVLRRHTMRAMVRGYGDMYRDLVGRERILTAKRPGPGVKGRLARALRWTGLNRLRGLLGVPRLTILTYHRVLPVPDAAAYPFEAMVTPRDHFEAQMALLRRRYPVLPLGEAVRCLEEGTLPRRAVSITFDDGYIDNYEYAWPILEKYRIPATLFLVTGAVDGRLRFWWDEVAAILAAVRGESGTGLVRLLDELLEARNPTVRAVVDRLNAMNASDRGRALARLRDVAPAGTADAAPPAMSWEQVREMLGAGVDFGAHTVSHVFVDELSGDALRDEILGSVRILGERLSQPCEFFSFPRGRASEESLRVLREAGIRAAVTTVPGTNRAGCEPLRLRRLDAGYCRHDGRFDPHVFSIELEGWFNRRRARGV